MPSLMFFAHDITDITIGRRVGQLRAHGIEPLVLAFRRARYNADYVPPWPYVELGRTADARYGRRLLTLIRAVGTILARRAALRDAAVLYVRNVDLLAMVLLIARLVGARARIVYEVLDVQPVLTGSGPAGRLLRWIERLCLRRVNLLVVSSPGFIDNYYRPIHGYAGDWLLMENKLEQGALARAGRRLRGVGASRPWTIGYFGLIRGQETFDLITRLAARFPDRLRFKIGGVLTTVGEGRFAAALERLPNLTYVGPYVYPRDLPRLYEDVDLAWAVDLENTEHNSRWLLPCRFYEAGMLGVPCLTAEGFEVGRLVTRLGVGWSLAAPYERSLAAFLSGLTEAEYARTQARLAELPDSTFVAGEDVAALVRRLQDEMRVEGSGRRQPVPAEARR